MSGATIHIYCSETCLRERDAPMPRATTAIEPPRRTRWWWFAGALAVAAAGVVVVYVTRLSDVQSEDGPTPLSIVEAAMKPPPEPAPAASASPAPVAHDEAADADAAIVSELAHDAWIHPLAGPVRRMPSLPDAAFGALRPGERPPECVSGHCGVDIGNVWGEPVHAVHDGVVDWVNRGPNDEHGGIFVKIAHRDGTLYTWYFHLAAVPRWVQRGAKVKLGQVIGLLGDTGVGHSEPHLHFSLSVKPAKTANERYIDPEALIAIWPLWLPNEGATTGRITMSAAPGMPVRQDGWRPYSKRHAAAATSEAGSADAMLAPDAGSP